MNVARNPRVTQRTQEDTVELVAPAVHEPLGHGHTLREVLVRAEIEPLQLHVRSALSTRMPSSATSRPTRRRAPLQCAPFTLHRANVVSAERPLVERHQDRAETHLVACPVTPVDVLVRRVVLPRCAMCRPQRWSWAP